MVDILSTFQVPGSFGLGMVEKWHVRGNSIGNRQSFSIALGTQGHKGGGGGPKRS